MHGSSTHEPRLHALSQPWQGMFQQLLRTHLPAFGPLGALGRVLRGSGECGVVDWRLLSFSIPEWTLAAFVALAIWAVFIALRD